MMDNTEIPFLLITGTCASGKSFDVKILKEIFSDKNIKVYDFDETIDLKVEDAINYYIELCIANFKKNYYTLVCGGITPEDIKKSSKYFSNFKIYGCLLNVERNERERRLKLRDQDFFNLINKGNLINLSNLSNQEIINSILLLDTDYKDLIKLCDD